MAHASNFIHLINKDNKIVSAGQNDKGQIGNGSGGNLTVFSENTRAPGVKFIKVSMGINFAIALSEDGNLYGMGDNVLGQLGKGTTINNGTIAIIPTISDVIDIACGSNFALAITRSGEVYATGNNNNGQLGLGHRNNVTTFSKVPLPEGMTAKKVACGVSASILLLSDGSIYGAGSNTYGFLLNSVSANNKFIKILEAIDEDIREIFTSNYSGFYINSQSELYGWGHNTNGNLGTGDTVNQTTPILIDVDVKTVDGSLYNTVYVKNDGSAWGTGSNSSGSLGLGDSEKRLRFEQINSLSNITQVFLGTVASYFLQDTLDLYAVGSQVYGQQGTTATSDVLTPIKRNVQDIMILPNISKPKTYPVNQPARLIATCAPQNGIQNLKIKGIYPNGTTAKLLISSDQSIYKRYDKASAQWVETSLDEIETVGMTIADVESLPPEQVQWLVGITFYVAISLATSDPSTTPIFSGIDAFIDLNASTPVVASVTMDYSVKEPKGPQYFVSIDDGETWKEVNPDELTNTSDLSEGKELKVKAVLDNGLELHGLSYSWV
ncbi:hypothetical protein PUW25_26405 (plasmid) [Paenibacillus urinalis]|uniref:RCC1-like domain-containing protein n=1 Tax=Paenibacillus urinalis TaxID=521520 RepID=A0ABY7XH62_9BACL|nr:hypothetical protein [Paenibacillus urinalis]WDI05105.1 hypothetical protein PUW25_26405 [Paenibacillus urinalis]